MKFKREYLVGGFEGKADPTDYIVGYKAENGKYIRVVDLINNSSYRAYEVDGWCYDTLAAAKNACAN